MIDIIKSVYNKLFSENDSLEKSYRFKSLISNFKNIAQYDLENLDTARIHTKDIIPYKFKNHINFKKEELYTVIKVDKILSESLSIKKDLIKDNNIEDVIHKVKVILEDKVIESIDKMILFMMSELGRTTTSIYGQFKESIGAFTISKDTTSDSIIRKLEYSDIVLKELNNIGLKHVILSKFLSEKLKEYKNESNLKINHKLIPYQEIPEYLESIDPLCLIASSQTIDDLTPGIVMIYKNLILDIVEDTKEETINFLLSKEYSIQKVGKKPEFFYIRFLQT